MNAMTIYDFSFHHDLAFLLCGNDSHYPLSVFAVSISLCCPNNSGTCCDMGQDDTIGKIELIPFSSCLQTRLIARMTFNRFLNCLMSQESMEITINTYRC